LYYEKSSFFGVCKIFITHYIGVLDKLEIEKNMGKWGQAFRLIGMGFYVGVCILAGVFGGLWLDAKFNTKPLFAIVGLILGLILAFWGVYQMLIPLLNTKGPRR
jgi:hypothetical protein